MCLSSVSFCVWSQGVGLFSFSLSVVGSLVHLVSVCGVMGTVKPVSLLILLFSMSFPRTSRIVIMVFSSLRSLASVSRELV